MESLYLPETDYDLQLLDPHDVEMEALEIPELSLEADESLLPELPPAAMVEAKEDIPLPDGMAPCLVTGCPGVNLSTTLKRHRHWHHHHVPAHRRFRCSAPGCRKVTRQPKDIRSHMRAQHGLTVPEALTLTFWDDHVHTNPEYRDPGTCPAPPGYAQWVSRMGSKFHPRGAATESEKRLMASIFQNGRRRETRPQPSPIPGSQDRQPCHVGCQTPPTSRDREWAELIHKWKAANRKLKLQVKTLSQENVELQQRLRATEASLEKAVGQRRKVLGTQVVN